MDIKFSASKNASYTNTDVHIIPVFEGGALGDNAAAINKQHNHFIRDQIEKKPNFNGEKGQMTFLTAPKSSAAKEIILVGMGKPEDVNEQTLRDMGRSLYSTLNESGYKKAHFFVDRMDGLKMHSETLAAKLAQSVKAASYTFDKYKSDKKKPDFKSLSFAFNRACKAKKLFSSMQAVTKGQFLAHDLVNEPANVLYPESYAKRIKEEFKGTNVKVKIIDEKEMNKLGMGAALAIGQGSARKPCMVVMEYDGTGGKQKQPVALVGKGVTFDSGGLSLKSGAGMMSMKIDMGGSAAVVGAMKALVARDAKTHVVSIVGLVENMPSSTACRPGDIVKSMSGKTVEILNTDAEGRMVLIDAMTYIQRQYDPHTVIDLATLTGACVTALGTTFAGAFTNDNNLYAQLEKAGLASGEEVWRMPLHKVFANNIKSKIADIKNMGSGPGGASEAAEFVHAVIEDQKDGSKRKWAHLDIAGKVVFGAQGMATSFGVPLLDRFIAHNYEGGQKNACASKCGGKCSAKSKNEGGYTHKGSAGFQKLPHCHK